MKLEPENVLEPKCLGKRQSSHVNHSMYVLLLLPLVSAGVSSW